MLGLRVLAPILYINTLSIANQQQGGQAKCKAVVSNQETEGSNQ